MKPSSGRVSLIARGAVIIFAALFLLFLSFSQPHRVHHFFEGHVHSHDKPQVDSDNHDHGEDQTKPVQTNCAVQSVAQNCQLGQVDLVQLPFTESLAESFHPQASPWIDSFAFFPFLQRAPPPATLLS
jgi:hypothetical protein